MIDTPTKDAMMIRIKTARQLRTISDVESAETLRELCRQLRTDAECVRPEALAAAAEIFPTQIDPEQIVRSIADGTFDPTNVVQTAPLRELGVLLRDLTQESRRLEGLDGLVKHILDDVRATLVDDEDSSEAVLYKFSVYAVRCSTNGAALMYAADSYGHPYGPGVNIPPWANETDVKSIALAVAVGARTKH